MNETHPGVNFHYESGNIYATCYFTGDFTAAELINRAKEIGSCFRQEE